MKTFILLTLLALIGCNEEQLAKTSNLKVGDEYEGGKVFYILPPGDPSYDPDVIHGFIVSDTTFSYKWGCQDVSHALFSDNGSENIDIIITYCGENTAAYRAFEIGWSLPTYKELELLSEANIINTLDYYWSSNKHSYTEALSVRMADGDIKAQHVNTVLKIRGIKEF